MVKDKSSLYDKSLFTAKLEIQANRLAGTELNQDRAQNKISCSFVTQ